MSELPVQGRDWMSLALLAPGNRTTATGGAPVQDRTAGRDLREFQLNLDGQQVTGQLGPGGQPRFSRDSIAEFQFISNRFDATQGRSPECSAATSATPAGARRTRCSIASSR
jgi:hypothetical protein